MIQTQLQVQIQTQVQIQQWQGVPPASEDSELHAARLRSR